MNGSTNIGAVPCKHFIIYGVGFLQNLFHFKNFAYLPLMVKRAYNFPLYIRLFHIRKFLFVKEEIPVKQYFFFKGLESL